MFKKLLHRFTIWGPPAVGAVYGTALGVTATAAPVNADAKAFIDGQMAWWRAVTNAPSFPIWLVVIVLIWLAAFLWSMEREKQPPKAIDAPPAPPAPKSSYDLSDASLDGLERMAKGVNAGPIEAERERLFQLELAKLEAPERARRYQALRRIAGGIGDNFADALEEAEADRKAEAEARRRRLVRDAEAAPSPPPEDTLIPYVALRKIASDYGFDLETSDPAAASNLAYEIEKALRQAAARGKMAVEGRQFRAPGHSATEPLIPIPPEHFREWEFRHGALHYEIENKNTLTSSMRLVLDHQAGVENVTFFDLHLSERGARAVLAQMAEERDKERETIEVGLPKWMEGRTRIKIAEAGCLAARVSPLQFAQSEKAQSKANDLLYYVQRGRIPVAGESPAVRAKRRGVGRNLDVEVPEVTLETFVAVSDLEKFQDKTLAMWLDVTEEASWRDPNDRRS